MILGANPRANFTFTIVPGFDGIVTIKFGTIPLFFDRTGAIVIRLCRFTAVELRAIPFVAHASTFIKRPGGILTMYFRANPFAVFACAIRIRF